MQRTANQFPAGRVEGSAYCSGENFAKCCSERVGGSPGSSEIGRHQAAAGRPVYYRYSSYCSASLVLRFCRIQSTTDHEAISIILIVKNVTMMERQQPRQQLLPDHPPLPPPPPSPPLTGRNGARSTASGCTISSF